MSFDLIPTSGWVQLGVFFAALLAFVKPLGSYMASVYEGEVTFLKSGEQFLYTLCGVDPKQEMHWRQYAVSLLVFSLFGFGLLFTILMLQAMLGLNPANMPNLSWHLAFNTAVSFITNTNWQSYGGEATMSYFSQMVGLSVQNFLSAAVGMAVLVALIRGFTRKNSSTIGNFWVDMVRSTLYILLPLSIVMAVLLAGLGVVQSFATYKEITTLEGEKQTIAVGPAASQIAIKQLGTNGGGFFNVNSAHPLENPTPFSNFLEMLALILIPAALCYTFGKMAGDTRQGWAVLGCMLILFVPLLLFGVAAEQQGNPLLNRLGVDQSQGNMEGKEARFGVTNSVLWATATTAASNGSVNSMHASYTPLGGAVPLIMMQFGEVVFGGVGSGLYGMLVFAIIAVFIAGLMVGRTPEYLGKKIQSFEMKMVSLAVLIPCLAVLVGTGVAVLLDAGRAGNLNHGAAGFSEILYAFTSASMNNGSAFAGLTANTPFYNTLLGIAMLLGRFGVILPVIAIAGSLAAKQHVPISAGTLPTHTPLFIFVLAGIVVMVGLLTFVPALALGPIAEHFNLMSK